jgi:hypothetical protein
MARTSRIGRSTAYPSKKRARLFVSGGDHLEIFDEAHSEIEDRFISIGAIRRGFVLVV